MSPRSGDMGRRCAEWRLLFQIKAVAKHPQLLKAVWTEMFAKWIGERNWVVRRRRTGAVNIVCRQNTKEAVLPQTQGREAAKTFGKSASGDGKASRWIWRSQNEARTRTCGRSCSFGTGGRALRKKRNNAFFSLALFEGTCGASSAFRFSFCATRRERTWLARYANDSGGSTEPPCWGSAGTSGACASEATICHTPIRVPKKAALVEPAEHLKTVGQLQCWAKGCPLNPPESGLIAYLIFWKGVVGGCPAAGGKGETFCVPTVLSCDTRGRHFIFSRPVYSARQTFGGFCKKSTYCNDWPTCGNRQMHKAEGPRSGTVATAADCACIACLRAWTKATLRAR